MTRKTDRVWPHCEVVVRNVIPALRALVATRLMEKYGLSQLEVSRRLGLTQPAISQYLHSKRGRAMRDVLRSDEEVMELIDRLAEAVYNNDLNIQGMVCKICVLLRRKYADILL